MHSRGVIGSLAMVLPSPLALLCASAWLCMGGSLPACASAAGQAAPPYEPLEIVRRLSPMGDGGRPTMELRYGLSSNLSLRYSAYYLNVPIDMNHNDSVEWAAGADGTRVLDAVRAIVRDPGMLGELRQLREDESSDVPGVLYAFRLGSAHGDTTWVLESTTGRAYASLDPAFTAMLAAFRSATGRPLAFHELGQTPAAPPAVVAPVAPSSLRWELLAVPPRLRMSARSRFVLRRQVTNLGTVPADAMSAHASFTLDGTPSTVLDMAFGNGARLAVWSALPPGQTLADDRAMGESLFLAPGTHRITMTTEGQTVSCEVRVDP